METTNHNRGGQDMTAERFRASVTVKVAGHDDDVNADVEYYWEDEKQDFVLLAVDTENGDVLRHMTWEQLEALADTIRERVAEMSNA